MLHIIAIPINKSQYIGFLQESMRKEKFYCTKCNDRLGYLDIYWSRNHFWFGLVLWWYTFKTLPAFTAPAHIAFSCSVNDGPSSVGVHTSIWGNFLILCLFLAFLQFSMYLANNWLYSGIEQGKTLLNFETGHYSKCHNWMSTKVVLQWNYKCNLVHEELWLIVQVHVLTSGEMMPIHNIYMSPLQLTVKSFEWVHPEPINRSIHL